MSEVKVSIMIPAYNVEQYIERCIRSAMAQTLKEIEIVVVNDGSTDGTRDIIERLAQEDNRIIVIHKPNGGLPSARNASLDVVQGQYIQTLDGDDWLEPTACEEMYRYATEEKLDIVVADYYLDDDHGSVTYEASYFNVDSTLSPHQSLKKIFTEPDSGMLCNRFVRRELYDDLRLPEHISYGEDIVTSVRLAIRAERTGKIDKAYYHYIHNPESISKKEVQKIMYQYFEGFKLIRSYLEAEDLLNLMEESLTLLEYKKITSFISFRPLPEHDGYCKGLEYVILYMTQKKQIPLQFPIGRKMLLHLLAISQNKTYIMLLSKIVFWLKTIARNWQGR
jgi:glycosyltransferase involved in cell wall biosynthesis